MARDYRPVDRDQGFLLPVNMADWLEESHLVWFLIEAVHQMDTSAFHQHPKLGGVGRRGYDPDMMVTLVLYAMANGVRSSRKIERLCRTDAAYRVICAQDVPDHTVLARFLQRNGEALKSLVTESLVLAARLGMVKLGVVAFDGTKIQANASKEANHGEGYFRRLAGEFVDQTIERDQLDDEVLGPAVRGDELPVGLRDRSGRAERIGAALGQIDQQHECMEEEQRERSLRAGEYERLTCEGARPRGRQPKGVDRVLLARVRWEKARELAVERWEAWLQAGRDGLPRPGRPPKPPDEYYLVRRAWAAYQAVLSQVEAMSGSGDAGQADSDAGQADSDAGQDTAGDGQAMSGSGDAGQADSDAGQDTAGDGQAMSNSGDAGQADSDAGQDTAGDGQATSNSGDAGQADSDAGQDTAGDGQATSSSGDAGQVDSDAGQDTNGDDAGQATSGAGGKQLIANLTDPESRLMKTRDGWVQGYNVQVIGSEDGFNLGSFVTQDHNDVGQFAAIVANLVATAGLLAERTGRSDLRRIGVMIGDAGYDSAANLMLDGPDRLIADSRRRGVEERARRYPASGDPPQGVSAREAMNHRLRTLEGVALYRRRGHMIETLNAELKEQRGLRRFSRRGVVATGVEVAVAAAAGNLLKIFRSGVPLGRLVAC